MIFFKQYKINLKYIKFFIVSLILNQIFKSQFMDFAGFNNDVNNMLSPLDSPVISGLLKLFLILYASMVAPHLPPSILKWFSFVPFKIAVLFLVVWSANHDVTLAILISVGFYATLNVLNGKKAFEAFEEIQEYN